MGPMDDDSLLDLRKASRLIIEKNDIDEPSIFDRSQI